MGIIGYSIIGIIVILAIIIVVVFLPSSGKGKSKGKGESISDEDKANRKYTFILEAEKGKNMQFYDPFSGFLIYGGAGSGKTKSVGKPLMEEYIRHHFAGLIYDYKDFDLTKTANHLVKKYNYPYEFYYLSFSDMSRTYRTNPISPKVITDENLFVQLMADLYSAYNGEGKKDEWFAGSLGILQGIAIRFYHEFPEFCTIPHIAMYACSSGAQKITEFLKGSSKSRLLGAVFVDAEASERTQASYLSGLSRSLGTLAFNQNICYVLSGEDFEFNLIDPKNPKLVSIANSYQIESMIAPLVGAMVSVSARQFTLHNKIPFGYIFDEATTFKISDFEKMPSVLREYLCSICFITQSSAKIEKVYNRFDRSSIESNLGNQFYGLTKDVLALETYQTVFGKFDKKKETISKGSTSSGNSKSVSTSEQKEFIYDTNFFTQLQAGRFVGKATKSNFNSFDIKFKMYNEKEEELPIVKMVLPIDLEENYQRILQEVANI